MSATLRYEACSDSKISPARQYKDPIYMLGSIGAGRLAAGLVELAVDGPARLVWLTST